MNYDCCFTQDNNWFRYRVGAIIIEDDCVLFVSNPTDDYYYSVGGGVHMGETALDAVLREVYEETGVHYEVDHLCVIHENFFSHTTGNLKGFNCHELSLYYLMKSKGIKNFDCKSINGFGDKESLTLIPLDKLKEHRAFPAFIKDNMETIRNGLLHIITKDDVDHVVSPL